MIKTINQLRNLMGREQGKIFYLVCLFLILSLIELIGISFFVPIIKFITTGEFDLKFLEFLNFNDSFAKFLDISLLSFSLIVLGVFVLRFILTILIQALITLFAQRQRVLLAPRMLRNYFNLDYQSYVSRSASDQIYNLNTLTSNYISLIHAFLKFISDTTIALAIVILLIYVNPISFITLISFMVTIVWIYSRVSAPNLARLGREANTSQSAALHVSQDSLAGFKEIKLLGKTEFFISKFSKKLQLVARYSLGIDLYKVVPKQLIELSVIVMFILFLIITKIMHQESEDSISMITVYGFAGIRLIPIFTSLTNTIVQFRAASDSIDRLYEDVSKFDSAGYKGSQNDKPLLKRPYSFDNLAVKNISYTYPDQGQPIIDNFSFKINSGEIVGVYGPSGVGKTTLINLLIGLIEPDSGEIKVNGNSYRSQNIMGTLELGYLPQETLILNRTILENITFSEGDLSTTGNKLMKILDVVCLKEFVESLPKNINTKIGEAGGKISGGQRQRISLARALYHEKKFLIMDEATNALDANTEGKVFENMINKGFINVAIIVSHRLTSLRHCNRIISMSHDRVDIIKDVDSFIKKNGKT